MQNFQAELTNISEWMRMNKLGMHPEKIVTNTHPEKTVYGH